MKIENIYTKTPDWQLRPEYLEILKKLESMGLAYLDEGVVQDEPGDIGETYRVHYAAEWKATDALSTLIGSQLVGGQNVLREACELFRKKETSPR